MAIAALAARRVAYPAWRSAAFAVVACGDPVRDLRDFRGADADGADADAEQQRQHLRVGGRVAADRYPDACLARGASHGGDGSQHAYVPKLQDGWSATRSLPRTSAGEIVRADREEVDVLRRSSPRQRRWRPARP